MGVAYANFLTSHVTSVINVRITCVKMSDNSDDDLCAIAAAACTVVIAVESSRVGSKRKKRRTWVRPLLRRRIDVGAYDLLMGELRATDTDLYSAFTRVSADDFDFLLSVVKSHITGSSRYRPAIPPDVKLAVTLRFLATGT